MTKYISLGVAVLALFVAGFAWVGDDTDSESDTRFPSGLSADGTAASAGEVRGTTLTTTGAATIGGAATISGDLTASGAFSPSAITSPVSSLGAAGGSLVLTSADFGSIVYMASTTGFTATLPAATDGAELTFVINTAFATNNMIIDSAEGDNIEGALIVAGAVVDCAAEDQINFVNDGENLGDYVRLISDGTNWYIGGSGALTAAKLTCTDPS